jgi:hypothetical protein
MRVIGQGLVTDAVSGAIIPTIFDVKKCKMQNNYSITMSSTKATELALTFDMYNIDVTNSDGTIDKVYTLFTELT